MEQTLRIYKSPTSEHQESILVGGYLASWHLYDRQSGELLFEITHPNYRNHAVNFCHHFFPFDTEVCNWLRGFSSFSGWPTQFKYDLLRHILIHVPHAFPKTSKMELEDLLL